MTLRKPLAGTSYDLLVIGGGIVGAGVARDAASRGLRTLLLERGDFASGTSSRSSRLLHGGLRYLAQGRVGLVREASVEKMRLSRIAPHLCEPLPFLFPLPGYQNVLGFSPSTMVGPLALPVPGDHAMPFVVPTLPAGLEVLPVFMQPVYVGFDGTFLGTSRLLLILDSSF